MKCSIIAVTLWLGAAFVGGDLIGAHVFQSESDCQEGNAQALADPTLKEMYPGLQLTCTKVEVKTPEKAL